MSKSLVFLALLLLPAAVLAQAVHGRGMVHTAEVDLAYETYGVAKADTNPVIAVNGGPGLSHAYMVVNDLWQQVAVHRLVVLYDQRGTGGSKHLAAGASQSMDAQVADLDAIRAHLGLEKVVLVGDSYGGLLAMAYAAAHPEHMARLVLSDSPGPTWNSIVHLLPQVFPDVEEQDEARQKALAGDPEAAAQASLIAHFRMIFYSPAKRDRYLATCGDLGFVPAVAEAVQKATSTLDLSAKLADFGLPVLVLSGRYDMNVAPLTAWRLAHAIPGARVVFFEESGHLPAYEEPERYLKVLNDFLAETVEPNVPHHTSKH